MQSKNERDVLSDDISFKTCQTEIFCLLVSEAPFFFHPSANIHP